MILSLVICTRNRSNLLPSLFESLTAQTLPSSQYEVLIVDNASTDDTPEFLKKMSSAFSNVRLLLMEKVGLSYARNLGWQESRGEYVGYIDDDCNPPPDYLKYAAEIASTIQPEVFGGPFYASYDQPKPPWFKDEYGSHDHGNLARPLLPNEFLDGLNMFLQKKVLRELDGFRIDLGMRGNQIAFGEETFLFQNLRRRNPEAVIYYDPRLFTYHLVRPEKWHLANVFRRSFIAGRDTFRVFQSDRFPDKLSAVKSIGYDILEFGKDFTIRLWQRDRNKYPYIQNYFYEVGSLRLTRIGTKYEMLLHENGD